MIVVIPAFVGIGVSPIPLFCPGLSEIGKSFPFFVIHINYVIVRYEINVSKHTLLSFICEARVVNSTVIIV